MKKLDVTPPAAATQSVLITAIIDAKEKWGVAVISTPREFLTDNQER